MARGRHVIELALDLSRMPALSRAGAPPRIPSNVIEIIRIAAGSSKACQQASEATGASARELTEAARFYIQQCFFRPDADRYRILGLKPGDTRVTARTHMRLLLQWLHPDLNNGLDAIYAERVLKAWREISANPEFVAQTALDRRPNRTRKSGGARIPWIARPAARGKRGRLKWLLSTSVLLTVTVWVLYSVLAPVQSGGMFSVPQ